MPPHVHCGIIVPDDDSGNLHGRIGSPAGLFLLHLASPQTASQTAFRAQEAQRSMTETGIYGGSFNPIHNGHTQLAERLCQDYGLDEMWLLVSPRNPLKQEVTDLLDEEARLSLARLAVRRHPCLKVSDFEFRLPRPSYTAHTLEALRKAYPDRRFTLVIGADNWLSFNRWKSPDEILRHHRILIYPRPGYPVDAATLPSGVCLADTPLIDISSTELRRIIASSGDASYGLAPEVWNEIRRKKYYQK